MLTVGKLGHEALAAYLLGNSPDAVTKQLRAALTVADAHGILGDVDDHPELRPANLVTIVEEWMRDHPIRARDADNWDYDSLPIRPLAVEDYFEETLGTLPDGTVVRIFGYLDMLGTDANGEYGIMEHKFTRSRITASWKSQYRVDPQNSAYLWAAQKKYGWTCGSYLNAIRIHRLPNSDRICKGSSFAPGHGVPYNECGPLHAERELFRVERIPEELDLWVRDSMSLASAYKDVLHQIESANFQQVDQRGKFNRSCRYCFAFRFCAAGRPAEMLQAPSASDVSVRRRSGLVTE